jgi:hypothetical protein
MGKLKLMIPLTIAAGLDIWFTLSGQAPQFWIDAKLVHEANQVARFFLLGGSLTFGMFCMAWLSFLTSMVIILPEILARTLVLFHVLCSLFGAYSWIQASWKMNSMSGVWYLILAVLTCAIVYSFTPTKRETGI